MEDPSRDLGAVCNRDIWMIRLSIGEPECLHMAKAHYNTCVKKSCLMGKVIKPAVWDQVGVNCTRTAGFQDVMRKYSVLGADVYIQANLVKSDT
jgi:hypothetical protein